MTCLSTLARLKPGQSWCIFHLLYIPSICIYAMFGLLCSTATDLLKLKHNFVSWFCVVLCPASWSRFGHCSGYHGWSPPSAGLAAVEIPWPWHRPVKPRCSEAFSPAEWPLPARTDPFGPFGTGANGRSKQMLRHEG